MGAHQSRSVSKATSPPAFATKEDMEDLKNEIRLLREDFKQMQNQIDAMDIRLRAVEMVCHTRKLKKLILMELKTLFHTNHEQETTRDLPPKIIPKVHPKLGESFTDSILSAVRSYAGKQFDCAEKRTNCDHLGRYCWASIVGGLDTQFLNCATSADGENKYHRRMTLEKAKSLVEAFVRRNDQEGMLLIRFVEQGRPIDGHTLILLNYESKITTFQAYFGVSEFNAFPGDQTHRIFNRTDEEVNASSFGFLLEEGQYDEKWTVDCNCCMIYSTFL